MQHRRPILVGETHVMDVDAEILRDLRMLRTRQIWFIQDFGDVLQACLDLVLQYRHADHQGHQRLGEAGSHKEEKDECGGSQVASMNTPQSCGQHKQHRACGENG